MQSQTVQKAKQTRPGTSAPPESTLTDSLTDPLAAAPAQMKPASGKAPVQRMGIEEET